MIAMHKPGADEYATSFAGYVARIADHEDIVEVLVKQEDQFLALFSAIPESRGEYRYAPGKWSIKDIVGHLCDTERVFAYRALRFARGDTTPLTSFDDKAYVPEVWAADRTLRSMVAELSDVTRATVSLFRNLPAVAWERRGTASDNPASVRALAYIIAGHARHHMVTLEARYTR